MNQGRPRLYLFSSNQSPQYAQDILNVLGAPEGQPYTFRYDAEYVEDAARETWAALQDVEVVVLFSLQQQAKYHEPVFVPIRGGRVLQTSREGGSHFVTFRIGPYLSLLAPLTQEGRERPEERVRIFTALLSTLTAVPYSVSASLGRSIPADAIDQSGDSSVLFARNATYLAQTATFEQARFVRILGIRIEGGQSAEHLTTTDADPVFTLQAGRTYVLDLFHSQPTVPPHPQPFEVHVDGAIVRAIGRPGFDIASRYDQIAVRLAATPALDLADRETVVLVEPGDGVSGPRFRLDLRVRADRGRAMGVAGLQALALIMVALAGALTTIPMSTRIILGVVGALAAVALGLFGAKALTAPGLPSGG